MYTFALVFLIVDGLILSAVVLMQAGSGGGLASLGGGTTSQVLGGRQATNLLTKATWWTGGIFMGLSLLLSVFGSARGTAGASEVQKKLRQSAPAAAQPSAPASIPGLTSPPPAPAGAAPATTPPPAASGGTKP
ncbi:MAG TPA: preprotein translocase subunit SecG [Gemmatimonadales bacterium]|jgi:preprotein translocase subunit SecG